MTESEWLDCSDSRAMIVQVQSRVSERKLRLIFCACVRRVWDLLTDPRSRAAVEASEAFAEGILALTDLVERRQAAYQAWLVIGADDWPCRPAEAAAAAFMVANEELRLALNAIDAAAAATGQPELERRIQCDIIRESVGNPFHSP